ncbi:MAG: hypothetical protein WD623_09695 [Marinobacter sp.]|uniref:hypothetical protein n=1 Tax=Marinobacter sp. TaxID=50741 RepID=UPI00349FD6EC
MPLETEAQRQFYLDTAGIQLWYARAPQPGAAPSPDFDFGEPIDPDPAVLAQTKRQPLAVEKRRSDGGLARVQGLMKDVESRARPPAEDKLAAKSAIKAPPALDESAEALKGDVNKAEGWDEDLPQVFSTAVSLKSASLTATWTAWVAESFVLVSTLSSDSSAQLQEALATNILRALGQSVQSTQTFMWPVFSNPVVPGNDAEGLHLLLAEFAKSCKNRSFLTLGLLPDEPRESRTAWLARAFGPLKVDFPHGLAGIATDPERKRRLWSELKPLVSLNR